MKSQAKGVAVFVVLFVGAIVVTHWVLPAIVRFADMLLTQNVGG